MELFLEDNTKKTVKSIFDKKEIKIIHETPKK